jgi:prolyl-tRNA synthetase
VAVCIRGDLTINEIKLRSLLGAQSVLIPDDGPLRKRLGLPVGYLGPCHLKNEGIREIIADHSVRRLADAVCGANKDGFHLMHVYPGRDMDVSRYADLGFVAQGDHCPLCDEGKLMLRKGIEVGQVFKLGQKYAKPMGLTFLTENNSEKEMTMGCYGIGVGRTAAAAIEQNHDKDGIIWPFPIAPYTVTVLCLDIGDQECISAASAIHDQLEAKGIDVLLDDRPDRPGVKFKDADLLGCPLRVTVGARGLKEGTVEVKWRNRKENEKISKQGVVEKIFEIIKIGLGNA